MLARLSSSDYPALAALKTRDDDDFTVAFLDATAMVLDILTFYQERLANESYLRTAGQLRSLIELSRLIGYQPSPGVSASAYVAFSLRTAPGQAPDPSAPAITIPKGTQVQSVPGQGQKPQIFETFADIQAKADWSGLPVQTSQSWVPPGTTKSLYLSGTSTQLQPGDSLLILGVRREEWDPSQGSDPSNQWEVVVLNQVRADSIRNLTYVSWDTRLIHADSSQIPPAETFPEPPRIPGETSPAAARAPVPSTRSIRPILRRPAILPVPPILRTDGWIAAKVFAFRQKASLFGHNAPNPKLFVSQPPGSSPTTSLPGLINAQWQWIGFSVPSPSQIDLDAAYPKIVVGSWFALTSSGTAQLYKVLGAHAVSISNFGLSGKVTELAADYNDPLPSQFTLPQTEVWAQSDQLQVAPQPLNYPLYGALLDLQDLRPDLLGIQVVALSGKRQKIAIASKITGLSFVPDDGTTPLALNPGDILTLNDPTSLPVMTDGFIPDWCLYTNPITLSVEDAKGRTGTVLASLSQLVLAPSGQNDPNVSEYAAVSSLGNVSAPYPSPQIPHTQIQLQSALAYCYDRSATTVNANVAVATQGQSVSEIMGNGSAATPNQSFTLRQFPLTYVQAPTPTGSQSTLQVEANGVTWSEVPSLFGEGSSARVFATLYQSDGTTDVLFGDGVEGATLPTGQNNIQANYRIGAGSSGNIGANTLTTLIDRPLGVSSVTNPEAATGGQDPESVQAIRANAPQTVLTLGRAVSLADYENYAGTFAGIAKANAVWVPSGPGYGVFLTVAGADGAALTSGNPTLNNLVTSLRNYGNPLIPITVQSFVETLFGFSADVRYDPSYNQPAVQAQVLQTLSQAYGFATRTFGQGVSADEISTVLQQIPGVVAINVKEINIVASSAGGDLASLSNGFTLSNWNSWMSQQVTVLRPDTIFANQISPYLPVASAQSLPLPAEILVLDPDPRSVVLGVMS
jgi:Baseplate J-like protein